MNGHTHRAFAAVTVLSLGHATTYPAAAVLTATTAALVTAGGALSPDADQYRLWKAADAVLPDEAIGGPLGHRQLTHWWGLPAVAAFLAWAPVSVAPLWVQVLTVGALLGWCSHLAGDFLVGAGGYGRGRGIPLAPWGWHVGVGIPNESWLARVVGVLLVPAALWLAASLVLNVPVNPATALEALR